MTYEPKSKSLRSHDSIYIFDIYFFNMMYLKEVGFRKNLDINFEHLADDVKQYCGNRAPELPLTSAV